MKLVKLIFTLLITGSLMAATPNVDQKVLDAFAQNYPAASQVQWTKTDNGWLAYFKDKSITNKLHYSNAGEMIYAIRYYNGEVLNPTLVVKLNKQYKSQTVFGVTEITINNNVRYQIALQDEKYWYQVAYNESGELKTTSKFRKG